MATAVNPDMKRIEQTFPVKLFENTKGPLQMPAVLTEIVKRFNDEGKKSKQSESGYTPIFSKFESNVLTIVSGRLACIGMVIILIIMVKQIRLQSLVTSLGLVSLIPPMKALYFTELPRATNLPYFLAKNVPNEKVVCSHPLLTWWVVLLPYVVPYMLHTKYSVHYLGIMVTKTADVVQCTSFCTMTITMHH